MRFGFAVYVVCAHVCLASVRPKEPIIPLIACMLTGSLHGNRM